MATITKGRTFVSGETVTPAKLNDVVDLATVTEIVNADIKSDAAVALSKLATGALPTAITVATDNIVDANVTTAKIADANVTNDKLSLAANAGEIKKALNADNAPPIYACRAWVSFQGRSTNGDCVLDGTGNVATVNRTASGQYNLTFTTAMPDANYAVIGSGHWNAVVTTAQNTITAVYPVSTTGFVFTITDASANTYQDPPNNSIAIFR